MCGRFVLATPADRLAELFDARVDPKVAKDWPPSWNVAKTDQVLILTAGSDGERVLAPYVWGLIPFFITDLATAKRPINAKAETVASQHSFRSAFRSQRCVIPADGYWEWTGPKRHRQPFYIHRPDGEPLALAGLYDTWRDRRSGADPEFQLSTCTVITTDASPGLAAIHNRMPALLPTEEFDAWLDPDNMDRQGLQALLRPAGATLACHPTDRRVGDVHNNDAGLIDPVGPEGSVAGCDHVFQLRLDA